MTEQLDKNFVAPLRMHFYGSKGTLDSIKGVFNVFWRKPLLGAPVLSLIQKGKRDHIHA